MPKNKIQKMQAECDAFNAKHAVGADVLVKLDGVDEPFLTKTRSEAQILSGHSAVIWLENVAGCYLIDRVSAAPGNNFKAKCNAMLKLLGATPGGLYEVTLPTVAGALYCVAHDDWLACKFDNVKLAKRLIEHGDLNIFSGKWNWTYPEPGPETALDLYWNLAQVVDMSEDDLGQGYLQALAALPQDVKLNTRLTYMYQDADNFKTSRSVVFSDGVRSLSSLSALLLALDRSEGEPSFIPGAVDLDDLQDSFNGCESRWDPERDHPWHEITSLVPVVADEVKETDERSIIEFSDQLTRLVILSGWDENYKPAFYPEMKRRHDQHVKNHASETS